MRCYRFYHAVTDSFHTFFIIPLIWLKTPSFEIKVPMLKHAFTFFTLVASPPMRALIFFHPVISLHKRVNLKITTRDYFCDCTAIVTWYRNLFNNFLIFYFPFCENFLEPRPDQCPKSIQKKRINSQNFSS